MTVRNAMEVFSLLDKSNCRKCGEKTCLAFAGAVFTGKRNLSDCPILDEQARASLAGTDDEPGSLVPELREEFIDNFLGRLENLDYREAAERCSGTLQNNRLSVKVLGKDFGVDREGKFYSDIHINPWVIGPFLAYVVAGKGRPVNGKWISFREMAGGRERYPLFKKRCEEDMCKIADNYPALFSDVVQMFAGMEVEPQFAADISVVLLPLPKVPVMICYWLPEDGIGSSLNIYFDATVDDNIGIDGAYSLAAGLTVMFARLAELHGFIR